MYDLICIGNITVDLYFKGESITQEKDRFNLAVGGKYLADFFHQGLGGGAANVAIDASSLDLDCAVCALVGENVFKQIIIQHLVKKNVSTELLLFLSDFINISTILLSDSGERTVIHYPTQTASFTLADHMMTQLSEARAYYFGHIPQSTLEEKIALIETIASNNKPLFLNLGREDCEEGLPRMAPLIKNADTLILNTYEFSELVGKKRDEIDFETDISILLPKKELLLVLTDGKNGSFAYHNKTVYRQKATIVDKIVDTTGVGDAFAAGFIASFVKEQDIQKSLSAASQFASKKLTRLGAN